MRFLYSLLTCLCCAAHSYSEKLHHDITLQATITCPCSEEFDALEKALEKTGYQNFFHQPYEDWLSHFENLSSYIHALIKNGHISYTSWHLSTDEYQPIKHKLYDMLQALKEHNFTNFLQHGSSSFKDTLSQTVFLEISTALDLEDYELAFLGVLTHQDDLESVWKLICKNEKEYLVRLITHEDYVEGLWIH